MQGSIYRLRLSGIPGRDGGRIVPDAGSRAGHSADRCLPGTRADPGAIHDEDFDQVTSGNFVTKVIYLPDPEFQELTLTGVETLVSTRLDPGVDPIAEADRRGSILAIVRMGNKDFRANAGSYNGPYGPSGPGGVMCAAYQEEGSAPKWRRMRVRRVRSRTTAARTSYDDGCSDPSDSAGGCDGGAQLPWRLRQWPVAAMVAAADADGHADRRLRAGRDAAEHDRRRSDVGHADHRHADRSAWSAAHSARRTGRFAASRHEEPHADPHAAAGHADDDVASSSGRA